MYVWLVKLIDDLLLQVNITKLPINAYFHIFFDFIDNFIC